MNHVIVFDRMRVNAGLRVIVSTAISLFAVGVMCRDAYAAPELKFAWPIPSRVTVTETSLKKGKTAKTRYDIVLSKKQTGENLELRFDKFELLEFEGLDVASPEGKALLGSALAQITALQGALPTLVLDAQGTVVDVEGMSEMVDRALTLLSDLDPKARESIGAMMRSPEVMAQIKEKSQDFWRVWVESWLNCSAPAGKEQTVDTEVPFMGAKMLKVPLTIHNEGAATDYPGNIRLSAQTILQGAEPTKALAAMMQQLASQVPAKEGVQPFSADMVKDVKRTTNFSVVTNPKTLQPQEAHSEIITDLAVGDARKVQTEKHDYKFDWNSK